MLSFTSARSLFGKLTDNDSSTNLTVGDILINEGVRDLLGKTNWAFLEAIYSTTTTASTQSYALPGNYRKIDDVTITVGTTRYRPKEVTSRKDWDYINSTTSITSNIPSFYYIYAGLIYLWPTPSSSSLTLTINYRKIVKDISVADYTTGSVTSIANAGTAVVGSGTTWTAKMAGRYIRFTDSDTANTGDGIWYQIASVASATAMTLSRPYSGTSISAGTAAYTIGDCMIIPEDYQRAPVYYAASIYWAKEGDESRSDRFMQMYREMKEQMAVDYGNKTTDPTVDDGENYEQINPNLAIFAT